MMIASPTTTSAAATTMTKNAMIWPSTVPFARAKVTSVRFTELSISSMHMNTTMALRRTRTPTAPIVNRIAASTRYQDKVMTPPRWRSSGSRPGVLYLWVRSQARSPTLTPVQRCRVEGAERGVRGAELLPPDGSRHLVGLLGFEAGGERVLGDPAVGKDRRDGDRVGPCEHTRARQRPLPLGEEAGPRE